MELLEDFMQSNATTKLYLVPYILKAYRTEDEPNSFSPISKLDLSSSPQDYWASSTIGKLITNEGPLIIGALARAGFNFSKFDRYDLKTVVKTAADKTLVLQELKANGANLLELLKASSELSPHGFIQLVKDADAAVFGNNNWSIEYYITSLINNLSKHVNIDLQFHSEFTKEIVNSVAQSNRSDAISQFAECVMQECVLDNLHPKPCTSAGIIDCYRNTQQHDEL